MRRILLITYYFPPLNNVASLRTFAFAHYLTTFGNQVTVLVPRHTPGGLPDDLNMDLGDIKVFEVDWFRPASREDQKGNARSYLKTIVLDCLRRIKRFWIGNLVIPIDSWGVAAHRTLNQLLQQEKFDVIVTSYSPISCHLLGWAAKKKLPDACWIADYRDLWCNNHFAQPPGFPFNVLQRYVERIITRSADCLTTVSEPLADKLRECYNRPTVVIENGYFPRDHSAESVKVQRNDGLVRMVYTGSIYPGQYDVSPLLAVIRTMIDSGEIDAAKFSVSFFGTNTETLHEVVSKFGLERIVRLMPSVAYDESLLLQQQADVLLFLGKDGPHTAGVLTGKIFEYMVAGPPVIAVGITSDNLAGKLIEESGAGFVCHNDGAKIMFALRQIIAGHRPAKRPEVIGQFRRDRLVERMQGIIEKCAVTRQLEP